MNLPTWRRLARASIQLTLLALLASTGLITHAEEHSQAAALEPRAYLPLIAVPGVAAGGATSDELIDAAEARGEIDSETALIYHVYVTFKDSRLPKQYQGDDSQPSDREIARQLTARFSTLSPQAKAILEPFTIPPYHSGSWWDLRQNGALAASGPAPAATRCGQTGHINEPLRQWHSVDSAGGKVKFWWQARYPHDEAKAKTLAQAADSVWVELTKLMGREPPSDQGDTTSCRGGDARLDISLIDIGNAGEAWPYIPDPVASPSYVLIDRNEGKSTLAHEMMHSFQFAFDVAGSAAEYDWWREATATWAEHYINPGLNEEHGFSYKFFETPASPLETYVAKEHDPNDARQYGAYLLPLFVQMRTGKPDFVRSTWELFETKTNSLVAINQALDGGFKKQWPLFTLANLNIEPVLDYLTYDKLFGGYDMLRDEQVQLPSVPYRFYELDGKVPHLAAHTARFTFKDPNVRTVLFENPFVRGDFPTAHVQATYQIEGQKAVTEDWTGKEWVPFCLDLRAERLKELNIVISNSEFSDRQQKLNPPTLPRLHVTNVACGGWAVAADVAVSEIGHMTSITETVSAEAIFKLQRQDQVSLREIYVATEGRASWKHMGYKNACSGSEQGSYNVADSGASATSIARMLVDIYGVSLDGSSYTADGRRRYIVAGANQVSTTPLITYYCPGSSYQESPLHFYWLNSGPAERNLSIAPDGKTITGTYSETTPDGRITRHFSWKMIALPRE